MRALIFSDSHDHAFQEFSTLVNGVNSRLLDHISCMDRIINSAKEHNVDVVMFTGDVYHLKNYVDSYVIRLTMEKLQQLSKLCPLILLPGNHDFRGWGGNPVLLEVLKEFVPEVRMGDSVVVKDWSIYLFPFVRDVERLNEELKEFPKTDYSIGLLHQDIVGQQYGSFLVEKGLNSRVLAEKFTYSFVGHFHNQKQIEKNVWSVGSPQQIRFAEESYQNGWLILDTEADKITPIINTDSPRFRTVKIKQGEGVDSLQLDQATLERDFFRIEVEGIERIDLSRIRWKRVKYTSVSEKAKRSTLNFSDSNSVLVRKYVESRETKLDHEELVKIGLEYLQ